MALYFLLKTRGQHPAAYVELPDGWAEAAHRQFQSLQDWDKTANCITVNAPWCRFLLDLGLIDEAIEDMLQDGNVGLSGPLHDVNAVATPPDWPPTVAIARWGLEFRLGSVVARTEWLRWKELGVETDTRRCRYDDCVEAHPVAGDSELVSCATCRAEMGLEVRV